MHERPYRLPDQRDPGHAAPTAAYTAPDPMTSTGSHARPVEPVRGPEYPAIRPRSAPSLGTASRAGSRRPVSAFLVAAVTLVLMIPAIMLLIRVTFGDGPVVPAGIVPAVLLMLGLPLTGLGLFALAGAGEVTRESWLRPPLAYLPIGILILMAAGLGAA